MQEKFNEIPKGKQIIWNSLVQLNYLYNLSKDGPAKEALGLKIGELWVNYQNLK